MLFDKRSRASLLPGLRGVVFGFVLSGVSSFMRP